MSTIDWTINVTGTPEIIRNCPKCGAKRVFRSGGLFRINAQQNSLDVWLIHRCEQCGTTWNMDIHTRVSPRSLDREEYDGYLANDPALAQKRAFDKALLRKNRAEVRYDSISLEIEGPDIDLGALTGPVELVLRCGYDLDIRLEKLLRLKLGLSRSALEKLVDRGQLHCAGHNVMKARFQSGIRLILSPAQAKPSIIRQIVVL